MRKHLVGTLVIAALAASASPAFTASPVGDVNVYVTAQLPPAPCLTVTPNQVDFGTLPFSTNAGAGLSQGNASITVSNCGTAGQNLFGSTQNANAGTSRWFATAYNGTLDPCAAPNQFYLSIFGFSTPALFLVGLPAPVLASFGGPPAVFPAGDARSFRLTITMPCQGSSGAGDPHTVFASFIATVA